MLQKTLRTPPLPIDHPIASSWGRFEGVVDIDALPLPQWHARVGHTSRVLSTNQFCYPGYWIWFIPLRGSVTSVGWVGRTSQFAASWRKPPGFLAMMRQHGAVASLMERAECIDLMSFGQLGYGTSWVFRPADRLALVGEAAAFADPFYSPGSDFIALENDFVTDLVARDLGGESADQVVAMGARYDAFIRFRFDAAMLLYRDLYGVLGSRELLQLKWDFDIANYYNLWFYAYLHDLHLDAGWLDSQLSQKDYILAGLRNFSRLFQSLSQHLWTRGQYHRRNLDVFSTALGRCDFLHHISDRRPRKDVLRQTGRIFNDTYRQAAAISGIPGADTLPDRPLFEFMLDNATWADGLTTG